MLDFDATIDLVPGLTGGRSIDDGEIAVVRAAIEGIEGAGWIDVELNDDAPDACEWLLLYGRQGELADSREARDLRSRIEHTIRTRLAT